MANQLEQLRTALSGRYDVERELGRGGMAVVYLARDVQHDRKVALKVLRPDLAGVLGPERFLREIKIAAALQHPHILPVFESGQTTPTDGATESFLYYVMPYVEGESLRERLRAHGELPLADAVRILRDVAEALAAAHAQGVVHRDIKPDNVLLSGRDALVSDFGVAKAVTAAAEARDLTATGVALGTPGYMAPEQATAGHVDHRADLYAFGVLAYETLTGRPPFEGATAQALMAAHVADTPVALSTVRPTVPPTLDALVMKCLAKRPADRWQSADELVAELESVATPPAGTTPTSSPMAAGRSRRRLAWVVGVVAVVAAGAAAAVFLRPSARPAAERPRIVVVPSADITGDTALAGLAGWAADWTRRELQETLGDVVDVVSGDAVRNARHYGKRESIPGPADVARLVAASAMVSPKASLLGGRVQLDAEITDVKTGALLGAVDPVSGPRDSVRTLVATLAEQAVIKVGQRFSPRLREREGRSMPPSLAAFREVQAGLEEIGNERYREALEHFERATALDSSYVEPLMHTWAARWILATHERDSAQLRQAEAVLERLEALEPGMSAGDRAALKWRRAWQRGDNEAQYQAAEELYRTSPGASISPYNLAVSATSVNRPERAVEVMSKGDPAGTWEEYWPPYWGVYAGALHQVGRLADALEVVQHGRRLLPGSLLPTEMRVQAALGHVTEVTDILEQIVTSNATAGVNNAIAAAREYRAHGHPDFATPVLEQALGWEASQPTDQRDPDLRGRVLYELGRWSEALPLFQASANERPYDERRIGPLGVTLARLGKRNEALAAAKRLDSLTAPYLYGAQTLWRARIRAALGDSADAVRLLRQALDEGATFPQLHGLPELADLASYEPFVKLMRPKG